MTDNEIIKALECCSEAEFKEDCKKLKCPFFDNEIYNCMNVDDENAMHRYSLDLINRQKAEIERLKDLLQKLSEIGYCHNFQLERSDLVSLIYAVCDVIKLVKEMTESGNGYNS